jgi:hypothetical protein
MDGRSIQTEVARVAVDIRGLRAVVAALIRAWSVVPAKPGAA